MIGSTPLLTWLAWLLSGTVVLLLPGYAWLAWFPARGEDVVQRLAQAVSLSISLSALVALVTFITGLDLNGWVAPAGYALLALAWFAGLIRRGSRLRPEHLGLGAALLALLAWRLYQVRILAFPAWVDSVHHALVIRRMMEVGGLPGSLAPEVPVLFYYHYTFQVLSATFARLTGVDVDTALLLVGQALNALVCFSVYDLVRRIWGDWKRAALAALLVGLVTQMPAYYATWGRYTLLTGLVLLPAAISAALRIGGADETTSRREPVFRLAVLTAGVLLSHYLAGFLLAVFLIIAGAALVFSGSIPARDRAARLLRLLVGALAGLALASPWLVRMFLLGGQAIDLSLVGISSSVETTYFNGYRQYLLNLLGPTRNLVLMGIGAAGLVLALVRGTARGRMLAVWSLAIVLQALPWGLRMAPFSADDFVIILFLPGAVFASHFLLSTAERAARGRLRIPAGVAGSAAVLSLLLWGVLTTRNILNPVTIFTGAADRPALAWVSENTPVDAKFIINVTSWQWGYYRGVDGGWWLLPITGRQTLLPPLVYTYGAREYQDGINSLARKESSLKGCDLSFWDLVEESGADYIYVTEGKGALQPGMFAACPEVKEIYSNQGVHIFQIPG